MPLFDVGVKLKLVVLHGKGGMTNDEIQMTKE
jgi:hypothetical protein